MSWKRHFSRFLQADRLHFAAHSHHPWPDVSFAAQQQAWLDAAALADAKWDAVFETVIPRAQAHVARQLQLPDPRSVTFATNTHELLMRLWSCCPGAAPHVLTTDGEFHSFTRQLRRFEEDGAARVTRVPVEPSATFVQRFVAQARGGGHDLVYVSQVFYNGALRLTDLEPLVGAVPDPAALIVIDGYHGFMAVPTDLSRIAARAFYLAGGYKYAMAGEGACFMHCPPGYAERPRNTGWLAAFGTLTEGARDTAVPYAAGGLRFLGATFDPTALYRFNAVQDWLQAEDLTVAQIRRHVESLAEQFLAARQRDGWLRDADLLPPAGEPRGNFLVFRHPAAGEWQRRLLAAKVVTDSRADRLRFGFGIYQDEADVDRLAKTIAHLGAGS